MGLCSNGILWPRLGRSLLVVAVLVPRGATSLYRAVLWWDGTHVWLVVVVAVAVVVEQKSARSGRNQHSSGEERGLHIFTTFVLPLCDVGFGEFAFSSVLGSVGPAFLVEGIQGLCSRPRLAGRRAALKWSGWTLLCPFFL